MNTSPSEGDRLVVEAVRNQLQHFSKADPPCRSFELPEGVLLRCNLARSLYFFLKTLVLDGKIFTRVFATDNPYERQKACIGELATPMFEIQADRVHLEKLEHRLRAWVDFVRENPDEVRDFTSFPVDVTPSM